MSKRAVRRLRGQLGMTQRRFAELLNVSQALVARWESGSLRVSTRSASAMGALARSLQAGVSSGSTWPRESLLPRGRRLSAPEFLSAMCRVTEGGLTALATELIGAVADGHLSPKVAGSVFRSVAVAFEDKTVDFIEGVQIGRDHSDLHSWTRNRVRAAAQVEAATLGVLLADEWDREDQRRLGPFGEERCSLLSVDSSDVVA